MYFVVTRLLFMAGHLQWPQQPSWDHNSQGADNFCSNICRVVVLTPMSIMHLGATIFCTLHYFFSFIHFCSLYSHSGKAVAQKCWQYSTPIFQNRIKMEINVSMLQTCHFHRPAHKQCFVNLRPLDLDHPYLDSQIFHVSRRQLHILGIRRIT